MQQWYLLCSPVAVFTVEMADTFFAVFAQFRAFFGTENEEVFSLHLLVLVQLVTGITNLVSLDMSPNSFSLNTEQEIWNISTTTVFTRRRVYPCIHFDRTNTNTNLYSNYVHI